MRGKWCWMLFIAACSGSPAPDSHSGALDSGGLLLDTGQDTHTEDTSPEPPVPTDWVRIEGGTFWMGTEEPGGEELEWPAHEVAVPTFDIAMKEVPSGAYVACVEAGSCKPLPSDDGFCYWDRAENADRPVTCANWFQAGQVCAFLGGRLPTEAEWEFAARSRGRDIEYPWGFDTPSCEFAVLDNENGLSCGETLPPPGCSRPAGNTDQGVCDMAGSLFEWTEDWMNGYDETPTDGSPNETGNQVFRVMRGGAIGSAEPPRTRQRTFHEPDFYYGGMGIRCARDVTE